VAVVVRDNGGMPLSDEEQQILREIEAQLSESDPGLVEQVSKTTLYRHSARVIRWAVAGLLGGLVLLVFTFARSVWLGVLGFAIMLACALVIEQHARKLGRAGMQNLTGGLASGNFKNALGDRSRHWRERFRRDDD